MMVPGWHTMPPPPPPMLGPMAPRQGEPGWTVWPHRVWPLDPLDKAPRRLVLLALVAAGVGTELCVDRYEQTGQLDADYLLDLSTDVEPVLQRLPQPMRDCARYRDRNQDAWYEFNLSRSRASHAGTAAYDACEQFWVSGG